ncbi:unnamed protein product, partial [Meganyctiphanes norvegica]
GVTHYSDMDYECTLLVTMPGNYDMYVVTATFENPSLIFETRGCKGDRLTYTPSAGGPNNFYCGDISETSFKEMTVFDGPKTFSLTWTSVNDGHTDVGWNITFKGFDVQGRR